MKFLFTTSTLLGLALCASPHTPQSKLHLNPLPTNGMVWSEQAPTPIGRNWIHPKYEAAAENIAPNLQKSKSELLASIMQATPHDAYSPDERRRVIKGSAALAINANKLTGGQLNYEPDDIDLMAIGARSDSSDVQHFVLPSGQAKIDWHRVDKCALEQSETARISDIFDVDTNVEVLSLNQLWKDYTQYYRRGKDFNKLRLLMFLREMERIGEMTVDKLIKAFEDNGQIDEKLGVWQLVELFESGEIPKEKFRNILEDLKEKKELSKESLRDFKNREKLLEIQQKLNDSFENFLREARYFKDRNQESNDQFQNARIAMPAIGERIKI